MMEKWRKYLVEKNNSIIVGEYNYVSANDGSFLYKVIEFQNGIQEKVVVDENGWMKLVCSLRKWQTLNGGRIYYTTTEKDAAVLMNHHLPVFSAGLNCDNGLTALFENVDVILISRNDVVDLEFCILLEKSLPCAKSVKVVKMPTSVKEYFLQEEHNLESFLECGFGKTSGNC